MKFSIIVPVYKVEKYLQNCIKSVVEQSYENFELILVNDGSPDNSGKICDDFAKRDSRIHVIHKENGGLSDARNAGLLKARGEYIVFLDSDDYMKSNALQNIADIIEHNNDVDMITFSHINTFNNGRQKLVPLPIQKSMVQINRENYLEQLYKCSGSYWATWKNVYKRKIIIENKLTFKKGLIGAEDCDFFMRFINSAEKFSLYNIPIVYYRIEREDSITNTMSKAAILGQLKVFSENYYNFENGHELINSKMQVFFANKFANTIFLFFHLKDPSDIEEVVEFVKRNKIILRNTNGIKYKFANIAWEFMGYYKGSNFLRKIKGLLTQ